MARAWFVHPHIDTLSLDGNGATVSVRRRLNTGEFRDAFRACHDVVTQDDGTTSLVYDQTKMGQMKVAAYLLDWTVPGAPAIGTLDLRQRFAVLNDLDLTVFFELKDAIDKHEATQVAARLEEKKEASTPTADPTSRSLSAAAGVLTGSAN